MPIIKSYLFMIDVQDLTKGFASKSTCGISECEINLHINVYCVYSILYLLPVDLFPTIYEPHRETTGFLHMQKKLISAFVFGTWIVQNLFYINPKFQASSHLFLTVQPGLCRTRSETQKTGFLTTRLIYPHERSEDHLR